MSESRDSSSRGDETFLVQRFKSPAFAFAADLRQIWLNHPDWPISKSFTMFIDELSLSISSFMQSESWSRLSETAWKEISISQKHVMFDLFIANM